MHSSITEFNKQNASTHINLGEARFNMIEQQIRTWDVLDLTVLQLLNDVPRERFVPIAYQGLAFADIEIPLGYDANGQLQSMLSPKLEGCILQALNVQKHQHILHIGTGSSYFTALLASLAKHVDTIEIDANLSAQAAYTLAKNNINNVTLTIADGILGQPSEFNQQLFDAIVYTGSSPREPAGVRKQLKIGGVLFMVLGNAPAMQATLIQRISDTGFREDVLFETCLPMLTNAPQTKKFEF